MSQSAANKQQLQDAFELFSQVSEQLTGSYQALQNQVVSLNRDLAAVRNERLQLLAEIRTLQQEASRGRRLSSMGEMTARLAHQVRTPLSTALLYASQLKQKELRREQRECFVDRLLVGLRHLDHMVNDMLVFARGGELGEDIVSVRELITQVKESMLPRIEENEVQWTVELPDGDRQVQGQREVLISVFTNLASNALDASGRKARLAWTVRVLQGSVAIAIKDNGPGIAEDLQEQVFEPFFTTRTNGTGLGLAVTRAVIIAHRGDIELDADYKDGARFVVRLPVHSSQQHLPSEMLQNQQKAAIATSRYV